jgi:hypothetical protein
VRLDATERQSLQAESRHASNLALADATVHDRELELSAITSHSTWMPKKQPLDAALNP